MRNHPCLLLVVLVAVFGCNMFSKGGASNSAANTGANANATNASGSPSATTPKEITKDDYVGRWGVNRDFKDHVIELREDGTGTIVLDEHGKTEAKQDFTWTYQAKNVEFTVKKPIVNPAYAQTDAFTIHVKLVDNGTKLQTDFSTYTRSKGEDALVRK
jgi:hypothetical protein